MRGTASFDVLRVKIGSGAWAVGRWKNPEKEAILPLMRNFAHAGKRNPLRDRDQILHVDIRDVITYATFGDDRLRGFGVARGRISHFSIDLRRRPCD